MCMYILMFFHDVAANQFYQTQLHAHLDSVWFRLAFVCMRLQRLLFDLYQVKHAYTDFQFRLARTFNCIILHVCYLVKETDCGFYFHYRQWAVNTSAKWDGFHKQ